MDVYETWYRTRSYGAELINKVRADESLSKVAILPITADEKLAEQFSRCLIYPFEPSNLVFHLRKLGFVCKA
jgi:hypothetical protein